MAPSRNNNAQLIINKQMRRSNSLYKISQFMQNEKALLLKMKVLDLKRQGLL